MAPIRLLTYREARRARAVATTARARAATLPPNSSIAAPIAQLADDLHAALDERASVALPRRPGRRRRDHRQPLRSYLDRAHRHFAQLAAHGTPA
jgi:hypothetical protein